ncbi:MAG: hypothetical protein ABI725_03205 [Chloroflexota bacterium]
MRGLRLFIAALFGLSVVLAGCEAQPPQPPQPTLDLGVALALAPACSGQAVSGAGAVDSSGTVANHLVLLNSDGTTSDKGWWLPNEWAPRTLADAELVACWQTEPARTVLEVCPYIGSDITRYALSRDMTVFAALSGATVADFTITAQPRSCSPTENADLTELEGFIEPALVVAHLATLIDRGRFVDPDPQGRFDPDWTPGPDWTSAPRTTDEPTEPIREAELRQALADGLVSVTGTGDGLQSLDLSLTSEVDFDLDVTIEVGTQLEPRVRGTQLMVVLEELTVSLAANATADVTLEVACAEMHQDQPTGDDTFHVVDAPPQADLIRLLQIPDFREESGRVQQFAVWTATNNPGRNGYVGLTSGFDIFGTGPNDDEIDAVRTLFNTAGIDTDKYRALK